jgi:hypothetical protein
MKTRMTTDQRRVLRDFISAVGVGKAPVLLEMFIGHLRNRRQRHRADSFQL